MALFRHRVSRPETGPRTAAELREEADGLLRAGHWGTRALVVVIVLALLFTMVNVQTFAAAGHPVQSFHWWIAWLLDPMVSVTLGAAILFEYILARYGHYEGWLTATKWFAGLATWSMNTWASWVAGSVSGVFLHSVAPWTVLFLAESAPRVRRRLSAIVRDLEWQAQELERAAADREAAALEAERTRPAPTFDPAPHHVPGPSVPVQERVPSLAQDPLPSSPARQSAGGPAISTRLAVYHPETAWTPPANGHEPSTGRTSETNGQSREPIRHSAPEPSSRTSEAAPLSDEEFARAVELARPLVADNAGRTKVHRALTEALGREVSLYWARKVIDRVRQGKAA